MAKISYTVTFSEIEYSMVLSALNQYEDKNRSSSLTALINKLYKILGVK